MTDREPSAAALETLDRIMKHKFIYDDEGGLRRIDALTIDDFAAQKTAAKAVAAAHETKVAALNAAWRAQRDAPLTECYASGGPHGDGECVHSKCPIRGNSEKNGYCTLPWRWDGYDDE